ncbi:MAG TPA: hypothetical protein VF630_09780, partial [Hymenobacter sp.]
MRKLPSLPKAILAGLLLTALQAAAQKAPTEVTTFNQNWQFVKDADTTVTASLFAQASGKWATVSLPHTPQLEPVVTDKAQWQGVSFYRKFFRVPAAGSRIAVQFGGAMHTADVYLNGQKLQRHVGGYLPFTVDISRQVKYGQEN